MGLMKGILNYLVPEEEKPRGRSLGRNDRCWCGSGRKYKHCHLHEDDKKLKNYAANCVKS
jgi:hypothetical protein